MTTTAFNEGVDLYARNENEAARQWLTEAINLSHYCNDEGVLETLLHDKFIMLTWDDAE